MLTILRDAGLSRLIDCDALERLANGFQFTEGPLWCPDGSLLFQDIKAEQTYRLGTSGALAVAAPANQGSQRTDLRPRRADRLLRAKRPAGLRDGPGRHAR